MYGIYGQCVVYGVRSVEELKRENTYVRIRSPEAAQPSSQITREISPQLILTFIQGITSSHSHSIIVKRYQCLQLRTLHRHSHRIIWQGREERWFGADSLTGIRVLPDRLNVGENDLGQERAVTWDLSTMHRSINRVNRKLVGTAYFFHQVSKCAAPCQAILCDQLHIVHLSPHLSLTEEHLVRRLVKLGDRRRELGDRHREQGDIYSELVDLRLSSDQWLRKLNEVHILTRVARS